MRDNFFTFIVLLIFLEAGVWGSFKLESKWSNPVTRYFVNWGFFDELEQEVKKQPESLLKELELKSIYNVRYHGYVLCYASLAIGFCVGVFFLRPRLKNLTGEKPPPPPLTMETFLTIFVVTILAFAGLMSLADWPEPGLNLVIGSFCSSCLCGGGLGALI